MVNTRAKIKKTNNTNKICFSQASTENSNHQSTQSGDLIGSNDDLLTEILLRLPVTSILRFKSVSKHWQWLLSHKPFTLLYDNLSKSPGLFVRNMYIPFDCENRSTPPFRSLDFYFDLCGIRIVQSCNGLLLCCSDRGSERSRKYYVFNPTTKQFAIIPSVPGGQNVRKTIRFMGLAFHQTDCLRYKVVCIRSVERYRELFQIHIYSSYTGKWKISSESFSADYFTPFWYGVYWNGAIHWAPSCRNPLYFKIEDEQLQTLPLPANLASSEGYYDGAMPMYFGESRGHLHLVDTAIGENRLHLNVYEMLNDHSGWFVKYQIELDELTGAFPEMIDSNQPPSSHRYYDFEVFDVVRGEKEEDAFMVVSIRGKIIRFNVHDKSFKQISDLTNVIYGRIGGLHVHRYTETLASFL
ncbi:putative F-box domain-containing protein [Helianthus annuus]|nr:putative F-box domain-containing protein [Helianthus annuus]